MRQEQDDVMAALARHGVIPVIAIDSVEAALPLADALLEGGLPVAEITFRTVAAHAVMRTLAERRPELILGAGTVITAENLEIAHDCGAAFAVAPGLNPTIVKRAQELSLPFVPGVATPTEIEGALSLGCRLLKFFPAEALGGIPMLQALSAPYKHAGVRFVPTGGVNAKNLAAYLAMEGVAAVGGTWIAKKEDLAQAQWAAIRDRCIEVCEIVSQVRG